jgi:hypothetical protein
MNAEDLTIAHEALRTFREGMATGSWKPFIGLLAPSFTMQVPVGELRGRDATREDAIHHFAALRLGRVRLNLSEPSRTCVGDGTVTFELDVAGTLYGAPYANRLVLSFDVAGAQVTAMREYFGEISRPMLEALP